MAILLSSLMQAGASLSCCSNPAAVTTITSASSAGKPAYSSATTGRAALIAAMTVAKPVRRNSILHSLTRINRLDRNRGAERWTRLLLQYAANDNPYYYHYQVVFRWNTLYKCQAVR